jgi:hypothetical protein
MTAAPQAKVLPGGKWGRLAQVVRNHPLTVAVSVLGTIATFIVGSVRVGGLVLGAGVSPIGDTIPHGELTLPAAAQYEYVSVSDDGGTLSVDVPTTWANVFGNGWHAQGLPPVRSGEVIGPGLNAAPSIAAWRDVADLETPGVFVGASEEILDHYTPQSILRRVSFAGCRTAGSSSYTNADFTGAIVTWSCGDGGAQWRVLAATPTESRAYLVYVQVKLVSSADIEAYNRILGTFDVDFDA